MRYIVFKKDDEIDPKKLRFEKLKNLWDVRYQDDDSKRAKHIYFQTPPLKLSLIEEDHFNYYLIFKLGQKDERFWDMVATIDLATVEEMCADPTSWDFKDGTPTSIIESHYMPSLRMSTANYEHAFYLTVPKTDDVTVFDQDETPVDLSLLKKGYKVTLLLMLDGVESRNHYYHLKFILEQAKARIPEEVWKTPEEVQPELPEEEEEENQEPPTGRCLLNDSEGDLVSCFPGNEPRYNHRPKEELYNSDHEDDDDEDMDPETVAQLIAEMEAQPVEDDDDELEEEPPKMEIEAESPREEEEVREPSRKREASKSRSASRQREASRKRSVSRQREASRKRSVSRQREASRKRAESREPSRKRAESREPSRKRESSRKQSETSRKREVSRKHEESRGRSRSRSYDRRRRTRSRSYSRGRSRSRDRRRSRSKSHSSRYRSSRHREE